MKTGDQEKLCTSPNWRGYAFGLGFVVLATVVGELINSSLAPANILMIYLLCVMVTAIFWGLGPSIMVSVLSVLAFDFFFVPPVFTFTVDQPQYIFTFIVLLVVGVTISYLASMVRRQVSAVQVTIACCSIRLRFHQRYFRNLR